MQEWERGAPRRGCRRPGQEKQRPHADICVKWKWMQQKPGENEIKLKKRKKQNRANLHGAAAAAHAIAAKHAVRIMAAESSRLPADDPGSSASNRGSGSVDDRQLNRFAIFAVSCAIVCQLVQGQHFNSFMILNVPAGTTRTKRHIICSHERSKSCEGNRRT